MNTVCGTLFCPWTTTLSVLKDLTGVPSVYLTAVNSEVVGSGLADLHNNSST